MSKNTLVLGTGMMGSIIPPIIRQAGGEVVGILGSSKKRTEDYLDRTNLPNIDERLVGTFEDYDKILTEHGDAIDIVAVLLPNFMHIEYGTKAAQNGKHILIEKPLATTVEDGKEFLDTVVEAEVAAEINSLYRHHELLDQTLKEMIKTEELGAPLRVKMKYLQGWQDNPSSDIGWRPVVEIAGRGKLVGDLGAHVIQTALHLFGGRFNQFEGTTYNVFPVRYKMKKGNVGTFGAGEVPSYAERPDFYEEMDMLSEEYSGDDIASARFVLDTERGHQVEGAYFLSQVATGHENDFSIEIEFEKGEVSWREEEPNYLLVNRFFGAPQRIERNSAPSISGRPGGHPHGYGDAMLIEVLKMFDVIDSGDNERIRAYSEKNIGDAVQAMQLLEQWVAEPPIPYDR